MKYKMEVGEIKRLVIGVLAHVDAGKTTLSEAMLYKCGVVRQLGRVDHKDAFLDTYEIERERGITVFSKQAVMNYGDTEIILLDTPGHVDFSSEMERTLQVLDCAVLVISGTDGIQGHTHTLWELLERYSIPVYIYVNKMDLTGTEKEGLLSELYSTLGDGCVDFTEGEKTVRDEAIAVLDDEVLTEYLEEGNVKDKNISGLIHRRKLFPCFFGSALKLDGVDALLSAICKYYERAEIGEEFGARVFKIARDSKGVRLSYMKVTSGSLKVKDTISLIEADNKEAKEKVSQIRIYNGQKYESVQEVTAGQVCTVAGLMSTYSGQGLGTEKGRSEPILSPVMTYRAILPAEADAYTALGYFKQLEDEDPQLHVVWNERHKEIHLQLMGNVQTEILKGMVFDRFGLDVDFGQGSIIYKETIAEPVKGIGHFEPLRHYAEVQLLLEPAERGEGLIFATNCSLDVLDANWQHLVLTHLAETSHPGVLTGSPITDMKISLQIGRAHLKHTEGGDFREATYRALQNGLMYAKSILLEPWYSFRLVVPSESLGRAISDIQNMSGSFNPAETLGEKTVITGSVPVSEIKDYVNTVASYTKGQGQITLTPKGYFPCHNQEEVVAAIAYNPESNPDFTPDSVFCSHGSGFVVKWDEVQRYAHLESEISLQYAKAEAEEVQPVIKPVQRHTSSFEDDKELMQIFEKTYGKLDSKQMRELSRKTEMTREFVQVPPRESITEYLLVDGYNIIFSWPELKELAEDNIDAARKRLMDLMCTYQSVHECKLILVFDAYKVEGGIRHVEEFGTITVVYTKQAETADSYIERASYKLAKNNKVRVATSDYSEQLIILGHGALRVSASMFLVEMEQAQAQIKSLVDKQNIPVPSKAVAKALEEAEKDTSAR